MDPALKAALLASLFGVVAQLIVAAYTYGKLAGGFSGLLSRVTKVEVKQDEQQKTISGHGERIARVEEHLPHSGRANGAAL
jgi:hypothetical protein